MWLIALLVKFILVVHHLMMNIAAAETKERIKITVSKLVGTPTLVTM
jgi:hypothetical protein